MSEGKDPPQAVEEVDKDQPAKADVEEAGNGIGDLPAQGFLK